MVTKIINMMTKVEIWLGLGTKSTWLENSCGKKNTDYSLYTDQCNNYIGSEVEK